MIIHLIANSHLDPVWLWDWREGLNEAVATSRTVLRLMDEFPELTYIRGETSFYAHVQKHDPKTFARIRDLADEGRWDVVGGTVCQPDTNLPATETLNRHFTVGLDYMRRELGMRPRVAWAADSFGHSAGWPEIYAAAGMKYFAFSRPGAADCTLPSPAFRWEGPGGRQLLCWRIPVGWYGNERDEVVRRLDEFRAKAPGWGLENVAVTYGLGNHGGGPTARQIREILAWRDANRDVRVEFSTFHRFFAALEREVKPHPVVRRELNFTLRGCYASAFRYKKAYRRAENLLLSAERTSSLVSAALHLPAPDLRAAWDSTLFNTFHDILPGTSIERAFDDQHDWLGVACHEARLRETTALIALAAACDTRVPAPAPDMPSAVPVLVWNPHAYPISTYAEFETGLDYRPIWAYADRVDEVPVEVIDHRDRPVPFQLAPLEHRFLPQLAWRKRFVVPVDLPAGGYRVIRVAWNETPRLARPPATRVRSRGQNLIANEAFSVGARPGDTGVSITLDGRRLFGRAGLQAATFADPYGSWGNHDGEREGDDISTVLSAWSIARTEVLERGPLRAVLWVMLVSGSSRLELGFTLEHGSRHLRVSARLLWNERSARLKLIMPSAGATARFEVPGGEIERRASGETPGGRWVRADAARVNFVFASDALYNFDIKDGALRATVVRSTRYARNAPSGPDDEPWRPHMDLGEHRFQFAIGAADTDAGRLADLLEQPVQSVLTTPHEGPRGRSGSLFRLHGHARLLALKPAEDGRGWIIRAQGSARRTSSLRLDWLGSTLPLGALTPFEIATWRLISAQGAWTALRVNTAEESAPAPASVPA